MLAILILSGSSAVFSFVNGGNFTSNAIYEVGTRDYPIATKITNVDQLQAMKNSLNGDYVLANDINASSTKGWNGGKGFIPVGTESNPFQGSLDGGGYNITGLFIDTSDPAGLFGCLKDASIKDINIDGIVDGNIKAGMIAGVFTSGLISNCTVTGNVSGYKYVGGVVGTCGGSIENTTSACNISATGRGCMYIGGSIGSMGAGHVKDCSFKGKLVVTGDYGSNSDMMYYVGGFSGYVGRGSIFRSIAHGSVRPYSRFNWMVGGFVGFNEYGHILSCSSNCTIVSTGYESCSGAGGFAGRNAGNIEESCALGSISSTCTLDVSDTGGFAGINLGSINRSYSTVYTYAKGYHCDKLAGFSGYNYNGRINNSFARGDVAGTGANWPANYIAGFVGWNRGGSVFYSYSTGKVSDHPNSNGNGGFMGRTDDYPVKACFWDTTTSGRKDGIDGTPHPEIVGKTTIDMKKKATFTMSGWDFAQTWSIAETKTYPLQKTFIKPLLIHAVFNETVLEDTQFECNVTVLPRIPEDEMAIFGHKTDAGKWLSFDTDDLRFSGTPENGDVGPFFINISVKNIFGLWTNVSLNCQVLNVNDPPVIMTKNVVTAKEDEPYRVNYKAIDVDPTNDVLVWSVITNSSWIAIDPGSGSLFGIPSNDDVGPHTLKVMVDDGNGGFDLSEFEISVINVNDQPMILTENVLTAMEDELYSVEYSAKDIDPTNDTLTWQLDAGPKWLGLNGNMMEGTPLNDDVGTHQVTISVLDGRGGISGISSSTFDLTVINTNDRPVIIEEEVSAAWEDQPFSSMFRAVDVDKGDTLIWSVAEGPDWLSIDASSGVLEGVPAGSDTGMANVSIKVEDAAGDHDLYNFSFEVIPVNDPPIRNWEEGDITIEEDMVGTIDITRYFLDEDSDEFDLSFRNSEHLLVQDVRTSLTVIPEANWSGVEAVHMIVSDGEYDLKISINVTVIQVNDLPNILSLKIPGLIAPGDVPEASVSVMDPDIPYGDVLAIEWFSDIDGAIGIGERIDLNLTPGMHNITVRVSDSEGYVEEVAFVNVSIPDKDDDQDLDDDIEPDNKSGIAKKVMVIIIMIILIILVILIAIGTAILIVIRKSKGKKEKVNEEDTEKNEGQLPERSPMPSEATNPPDHPAAGQIPKMEGPHAPPGPPEDPFQKAERLRSIALEKKLNLGILDIQYRTISSMRNNPGLVEIAKRQMEGHNFNLERLIQATNTAATKQLNVSIPSDVIVSHKP